MKFDNPSLNHPQNIGISDVDKEQNRFLCVGKAKKYGFILTGLSVNFDSPAIGNLKRFAAASFFLQFHPLR
jgi:hypothetical protein